MKRVDLHPKVPADGEELAAEFYRELRRIIVRAVEQPGAFAVRERDRRTEDVLRVLVVRHHRQRPSYGIRRR